MARRKNEIPSYLLHQKTGQARVRVDGHDYYLGPYGSEESRRKYGALVAKFASGELVDPFQPSKAKEDPGPSVAELSVAFLDHAQKHYVKNGKPTDEVHCFRSAIGVWASMYGLTPLAKFGSNDLRAVRAKMVDKGWSRGYCNKSVNRIRHMVKWGVARDMCHPDVLARLVALEPLLAGRTTAHEPRPRGIVPDATITAVKAVLRSKPVKALIDLQRLTAARSGELVALTTAMVDTSGAVWVATIQGHKTAHHGHSRVLYVGPHARAILAPWLNPANPTARLFQIQRSSYGTTIKNACERAQVPSVRNCHDRHYSPHQ